MVNVVNTLNNIDIIDTVYRQTSAFKMSGRPVVRTPKDTCDVCLHYWDTAGITAGVIALFLNEDRKVLELYPVFEGKFTETSVDPVRIIKKALGIATCSIVMARRYNTQRIHVSEADWKLAKELNQATERFDISAYDYVIIGSRGHHSFRIAFCL